MPGALEGLRVVDLTTGLAGPMATMTLSDHGADVVKVEPARGDPQRGVRGLGRHQPREAQRGARPRRRRRPRAAPRARRHRRRARRELRARVPRGARARLRHGSRRPPGARSTARSPATRATPTPPTVPPSTCSCRRARACSTSSPASATARSSCTRRCRASPRRTSRSKASSPRCTPASSPGAGSGWRRRSTRACSRSPRSCGRTSSTGCEPWFEIGFEPRPSIYECADGLWVHSMHFAGGRGKDRSIVWGSWASTRPSSSGTRPGVQAFEDDGPRGDRAHEAPGPARPVLGQRDPDRAGAARATRRSRTSR